MNGTDRKKITFADESTRDLIKRQVDAFCKEHGRRKPDKVDLPRAQQCMGFWTGKGATVKVKVGQYERQ